MMRCHSEKVPVFVLLQTKQQGLENDMWKSLLNSTLKLGLNDIFNFCALKRKKGRMWTF